MTILGNVKDAANHSRWLERVVRVLSGNTSYGSTTSNADPDQNIDCWKASGTTPGSANADFTIAHSLGRVPFCIVGQVGNNGGTLYHGSAAWTNTTVTLRCTTASMNYTVILA
jgi:hypothetical protein